MCSRIKRYRVDSPPSWFTKSERGGKKTPARKELTQKCSGSRPKVFLGRILDGIWQSFVDGGGCSDNPDEVLAATETMINDTMLRLSDSLISTARKYLTLKQNK